MGRKKKYQIDALNNLTPDERLKLVNDNLRFAMFYAKKYLNKGLDFEDIYHAAVYGMAEAAERYTPNTKTKFTSFAVFYIRVHIQNTLSLLTSPVKKPHSQVVILQRIRKVLEEQGEDIPVEKIAEFAKLSVKVVENAMNNKINGFFSLNEHVGDGSNSSSSAIKGPLNTREKEEQFEYKNDSMNLLEEYIQADRNEYLTKCIDKLSDIEKDVIVKGFFEDKNLYDLAKEHNMTPQGIRAIRINGLARLKEMLCTADI